MKLTGENRQLGEKPVPVPLCPLQTPHGLTPGSNPGLRGERPATNRLSHGTAPHSLINELCPSSRIRNRKSFGKRIWSRSEIKWWGGACLIASDMNSCFQSLEPLNWASKRSPPQSFTRRW
jgi:hypothetical protein